LTRVWSSPETPSLKNNLVRFYPGRDRNVIGGIGNVFGGIGIRTRSLVSSAEIEKQIKQLFGV